MKREPLNYQNITQGERPVARVRFQTIISCSFLALAALCALAALLWPHRRSELFAAAISLAAAGLVVLLPFRRF
jgi:hypothetical protein